VDVGFSVAVGIGVFEGVGSDVGGEKVAPQPDETVKRIIDKKIFVNVLVLIILPFYLCVQRTSYIVLAG
jgi:hypothetical protein